MQKFIFKRHLSCIVFELPIFIYLLHLKRVHNNIYILMVKLIAEGVTLEAPQEFQKMTTFFDDVREFEGNKDEFVFNLIKKVDMERILHVTKLAGYNFKRVPKVNSNDPRAYLSEELVEFFSGLKSKSVVIQMNNSMNCLKLLDNLNCPISRTISLPSSLPRSGLS